MHKLLQNLVGPRIALSSPIQRLLSTIVVVVTLALNGCSDYERNRSPLSTDDPARAARAREETIAVEAASKAAEAAFFATTVAAEEAPFPEANGPAGSLEDLD